MSMDISGQSSPGHTLTSSVDAADRRNMPTVQHSGYKAIKRIVHTFSLCVTIALLIYFFYLYQQHSRQWAEFEAGQTGTLLVHQYALLLAPVVTKGNDEELEKMVATLNHHPALVNAAVYDSRGVLLSSAENHLLLLKHLSDKSRNWVVHIEDIRNDSEQTIGYLRLVFNAKRLLAPSLDFEKRKVEMVYVLMILTFLLGVYLARSFYKFRPVLKRRILSDDASAAYPSTLNKRQ
ncbi:AhpA/YtjB family protein [Alteromonas sp. ASW11-130]|uniref:AhpA/YtjB family protein n=1 Tax=Alteromonas sp. ASW11-130 TaxID=3015775 RepID=UPI0022420277|nr:AhpA/YtjB family protein [Alteromonas sp. ASW11-130]MCW8092893.1 AhpA/YtjB family protein [Alteromonas sp. ASW11-130]